VHDRTFSQYPPSVMHFTSQTAGNVLHVASTYKNTWNNGVARGRLVLPYILAMQ
jgi:hypothetical protein